MKISLEWCWLIIFDNYTKREKELELKLPPSSIAVGRGFEDAGDELGLLQIEDGEAVEGRGMVVMEKLNTLFGEKGVFVGGGGVIG